MSYLNHAQDPQARATAFAGTVAVHALLGLAVVTGLTITGFVTADEYKPIIEITPDPLPKPPPPEQRPEQKAQDSIVTVPPTPYTPPAKTDDWAKVDTTPDAATLVVKPGETLEPTILPTVTPTFTPSRVRPRNNPGSWLSPDDYPRRPLVDGIEGSAAYRLIVGTNGKVSACEVTRSTGNAQLDAATCKHIASRARFEPATDETGAKVVGSYTGNVKWEIPE